MDNELTLLVGKGEKILYAGKPDKNPRKITGISRSIRGRAVYLKSPRPSPTNALIDMTSVAYICTSKSKWIVAETFR